MTLPAPPALPAKRFVVDSMLGKVAKWLRILGFDTLYEPISLKGQITSFRTGGYLVITRNRKWCDEPGVLCLAENSPLQQLQELVGRIPIERREIHLLKRCLRCNALLERVSRDRVFGQVPDYILETTDEFARCRNCLKIYWSGSHLQRITDRLDRILGRIA